MIRLLRHLLLLLVAFAIIGGTTSELARAAAYGPVAAMADMPCDMAMPTSASGGDATPMAPCKGMTADCIKQMGCVTVQALPAHFISHETAVQYSTVDYWASFSKLVSLAPEPEPLPPRTA
ncbi:MAG TPA: hypothetical protein VKQ29_09965 [Aliidongia sp.]|nr:hypothetical protein [Aliidongia sp.]